MSGALPQHSKLPPTRVFAQELGVSRSTVVTAYEQLVAEGYIEGRRGAGYFICGMQSVEIATPPAPTGHASLPPDEPSTVFVGGNPDMRLFPHSAWSKTVARVSRQRPKEMLVSSSIQGNLDLRQAISDHVREWRGVPAEPEQIFVTAGSIEALELCFRAVCEPKATVVLENPGYLPMRRQVIAQGLTPVFTSLDDQGAVVPASSAELAVLTPSHQYPLGGTMSPSRRQAFLSWAKQNDSWIVEDDYDSEFRYAGRPIPAMAGFDSLERTIYVGSFSKVFSSGLRLGYVIVPYVLRDRFANVLKRFGGKASVMPQAPLAEFMKNGDFYRHLRRVRRHYAKRRELLAHILETRFSQFGSFQDHQAGMQLAFFLNPEVSDKAVASRARKEGIIVGPISEFYAEGPARNGLLLGFCGFSPEEMQPALETLLGVLSTISDAQK